MRRTGLDTGCQERWGFLGIPHIRCSRVHPRRRLIRMTLTETVSKG